MISTSNSEKWQKTIQGIEAAQKELSSGELSAFQALKELYSNGNFEAGGTGGNIKILKNSLSSHNKNRLLKAHLTNFVALCEQHFTNKSVSFEQSRPQVPQPAPPPEIKPQTQPASSATVSPTFGGIPSEDMAKWQKAVQGIEAEQKLLSPNELYAFESLKELFNKGNFESGESLALIRIIKEALPSHGKHRLLQKVHLPSFIYLCEKYFNGGVRTVITPPAVSTETQHEAPAFKPPVFKPPVINEPPKRSETKPLETNTSETRARAPETFEPRQRMGMEKSKGNNKQIILIVAALALLIGGWQLYQNWNKFFGKPKEIIIDESTLMFDSTGVNKQLTATILPEDISEKNKKITWHSSDALVSVVNENGVVTAVGNGDAHILAYTVNGLSDTCYVTVCDFIDPDNIKIDTTALSLNVKETRKLTAFVIPEEATNKSIWWFSDNSAVATVDSTGLVTAIAEGNTLIWAYTVNGFSDTCLVMVYHFIDATGVNLDRKTLSLKEKATEKLASTVSPEDATNKNVFWLSDKPAIATVDSTGLVTAVAKGDALIVAYLFNGFSDTCRVAVGDDVLQQQQQVVRNTDTSGTISVYGGTYTGEIKNGQPHGMGTIRYNSRTIIDSRDTKKRYAEAGQSVIGQFRDGRLLQGKLFDSRGNQIETIIIGGGVY